MFTLFIIYIFYFYLNVVYVYDYYSDVLSTRTFISIEQ